MEWLKIGGKEWNVNVLSISENFTILYTENTGRTISVGARMTLDPLGTFFGHKVTVGRRKDDFDEFDELFDFISKPRFDGVEIEIVHGQKTISYDAYISSGERKVKRIDNKNKKVYYDTFEIEIIPMEAQLIP